MNEDLRKYLAEGIGTFVLVFGGVGTAVIVGPQVGTLGVAFAFGLALLIMAYAIGPISGCHINPAVTLAMVLLKRTGLKHGAWYVFAQIVGAIIAAGAVALIAKGQPGGYDVVQRGLGANGFADHSPALFNVWSALAVEVILTALLVLTILGSTDRKALAGFAGLPIGLSLIVIHLVSLQVTNTSANPARSIGPAVFVGDWALEQLWLFIVAPLVGAVIAVGAYLAVHTTDPAELSVPEAMGKTKATGKRK